MGTARREGDRGTERVEWGTAEVLSTERETRESRHHRAERIRQEEGNYFYRREPHSTVSAWDSEQCVHWDTTTALTGIAFTVTEEVLCHLELGG